MTKEEIKDAILREWEKGNIVFETIDGLMVQKFSGFLEQPLAGQLYDLNRNYSVITTFLGESPWNNEFGMLKLVEYYHDRCKELEEKLKNYEKEEK